MKPNYEDRKSLDMQGRWMQLENNFAFVALFVLMYFDIKGLGFGLKEILLGFGSVCLYGLDLWCLLLNYES